MMRKHYSQKMGKDVKERFEIANIYEALGQVKKSQEEIEALKLEN